MPFVRLSGHLLIVLSVVFLAVSALLAPVDGARSTRESAAETTSSTVESAAVRPR